MTLVWICAVLVVYCAIRNLLATWLDNQFHTNRIALTPEEARSHSIIVSAVAVPLTGFTVMLCVTLSYMIGD